MPVSTVTTSAAGSLALLRDDDRDIRSYALSHLLSIVPQFWAEIGEDLPLIESLADPQSGELPPAGQPLAALLCSKVYFYLGERDEAVEFALRAAGVFGEEPQSEYKETIVAGCIDCAIAETQSGQPVDPRLEDIVAGVIKAGAGQGAKLAIGLALSIRRLNLIEAIYLDSRAPDVPGSSSRKSATSADGTLHDENLLRYILSEAVGGVGGTDAWPDEFRRDLLTLLLGLFKLTTPSDYNSIAQIWVQLDDALAAGDGIVDLLEQGGKSGQLEAYQIGYDLVEVAPQGFLERLRARIAERGWAKDGTVGTEDQRTMLEGIVDGSRSAQLFLNFLKKNNQADLSILKTTKESLDDRYSLFHSAITFAHAYATIGTTSDKFMRENLDWLGRASNWAKFSATAALGLIHRGSYINGIRVVRPYLPGGAAPSRYSEGGGLFALGLIYAGRKEGPEQVLRQNLAEGVHPIVQHGAALGIGVAGIASGDEEIYDDLKNILFQDNATSSEAAGYAMGLIMLGQPNEQYLDEMTAYAAETQHEKIIRSIAVGVALTMYGRRDGAKAIIDKYTSSNDAILRYGGMFTYALAYVGTADNKVVKQLLHYAVSDVNDDVRRAAVIALGFVLFRNYTQVPRVVQLLSESYNPHVRHGATLALGISCAGTGLDAAIEMLEPMTKDPVDFVRQGAYISLAMILIQQTEAQTPKVAAIRELFAKVVADKHEDPMARFGAALAQGIIDAGGRNMTISLATRAGTPDMKAVVGAVLFVQFWYWFPLAHFLGLTFSPTTVLAVDGEFRLPAVEFTSHAKPSMFDYPSTVKVVKEEKQKKAKAAVLSTTAKAHARAKSKRATDGDAIDTDEKDEADAKVEKDKERKPAEPAQSQVANMSRIVPAQLPFLTGPYDTVDPSAPASVTTAAAASSTSPAAPPKTVRTRFTPLRDVGDAGAHHARRRPDGKARPAWSGRVLVLADEGEGEYEHVELDASLWPANAEPEPVHEAEAEQAAAPQAASAISAAQGDDWDAPVPASFEFPFDD
ncbi:proteasome regulatory particle base subunit [Cryptotrichosporon argae]